MKNLISILIISTFLSCCSKDDKTTVPVTQVSLLPPATQIGANKAGCLVNGKAFLPNGGSLQPLVCNYINQNDLTIGIGNKTDRKLNRLLIGIFNTNLVVGQTYILKEKVANSKFGEFLINEEASPSPNYYSTNKTFKGEITITNHDYNNVILSGTFWFDAVNSDGTKVEVREGRFDMKY